MTTTLVTGIAELVTSTTRSRGPSTPRLGLLHDAAVVVDDGRVAVDRAGVAGAGRRRAARPGGPRRGPRVRRLPHPPGVRRRPGGRVRGPDDRHAVRRRRHRDHGRRDPGGDRRRAALPCWRRGSREMRAQGTTTVEIKSGYGLTVADEARALRIAREVTAETTFLGAHVVPGEYAGRRDEYVDLVTGPMLRGLRAARPLGRRVLRAASAHAFDGDEARRGARRGTRGRSRPAGARQPARPRPRRAARRRARGGQRRPLHVPERRRRRRAGRGGRHHGGDAAARRGVLHPLALPGRPRACSTPGSRSRWRPTATRAPATRRRCRS